MNRNLSEDELKELREGYRDKAFWMMFEVALIFGLPAFAAVALGRLFALGRPAMVGMLAFTFVASWVAVAIRYRRLDREMQEVDRALKESKERK